MKALTKALDIENTRRSFILIFQLDHSGKNNWIWIMIQMMKSFQIVTQNGALRCGNSLLGVYYNKL